MHGRGQVEGETAAVGAVGEAGSGGGGESGRLVVRLSQQMQQALDTLSPPPSSQ
jgi:hypothetical protein